MQPTAEKNCGSVNEIFPQLEFQALNRPVDSDDITYIHSNLQQVNCNCPLAWMLMPETSTAATEETLMTNVTSQLLDLTVENTLKRCVGYDLDTTAAALSITFEQMLQIEKHTKEQRNNALWFRLRQNRLTASNFGAVLSLCKRQQITDSLLKKICG
jgi:hypothetical protein